jgi:hypothetical protein
MAIDIESVVKVKLAPALLIDTDIETDLPIEIESQIALQGWSEVTLSEAQKVYIALLTLRGLIPRLLLAYSAEIKKVKGGPAEVEFNEAIKFLQLLSTEVAAQIKQAQREVAPEDDLETIFLSPPQVGYKAI